MNPNLKGTIGELAVTQDLLHKGFYVFAEVTKHSKVDLVAMSSDYGRSYKVQVKTVVSKNDQVYVDVRKSCLNKKYNSFYTVGQNDYYAVYIIDQNKVFYIPEELFLSVTSGLTFSLKESEKLRCIKDYNGPLA